MLFRSSGDKPATSEIWRDIRKMLDKDYPDAVLVSEWSNPQAVRAGFHADFMLDHHGNPYNLLVRAEEWGKKSYFDAVDVIKMAAEKNGITSIEATYRWLAYHSMLNAERGDAILIGASKLNHLKQNMDAVKAGSLPEEVAAAFDEAWQITKGDSPEYFTLYKGRGSVGGEKK